MRRDAVRCGAARRGEVHALRWRDAMTIDQVRCGGVRRRKKECGVEML